MTPPSEAALAYSNVPNVGGEFHAALQKFFEAPATEAQQKKLEHLRLVEKTAGMLDDMETSVDDLIASRHEAAQHGW